MSQSDFAAKIGVTGAAVSRWEAGDRNIPDIAIKNICREFGINETWLRTGEGEMRPPVCREEEIAGYVHQLMAERPDSFKSALITTLLRLDPQKWNVLEEIYEGIAAEIKKDTEP